MSFLFQRRRIPEDDKTAKRFIRKEA